MKLQFIHLIIIIIIIIINNKGFDLHPKNSTSKLAHCSNSRGHRTYWEEYGANFMIHFHVLY
jgi:hypothetical protein